MRLVLLLKCKDFLVWCFVASKDVNVDPRARSCVTNDKFLQLGPLRLFGEPRLSFNNPLGADKIVRVACLAIDNPGPRATDNE